MASYNNKSLSRIYTTYHKQNCWAYISGVGWRKVHPGNPEGVTNVHIALTAARANGKKVSIRTNAADTRIDKVYL